MVYKLLKMMSNQILPVLQDLFGAQKAFIYYSLKKVGCLIFLWKPWYISSGFFFFFFDELKKTAFIWNRNIL